MEKKAPSCLPLQKTFVSGEDDRHLHAYRNRTLVVDVVSTWVVPRPALLLESIHLIRFSEFNYYSAGLIK